MGNQDNFYQHVHDEASIAEELRGQINELRDLKLDATSRDAAVNQCLTGISNLTNEIRSRAQDSASHDQRTYNETIKGLSDLLQRVRSEITPRRKFAFKSAPKTVPADSPPKVPDEAPTAETSSQSINNSFQLQEPDPAGISKSPKASSFTNACNAVCIVPSSNDASGGMMFADNSRCVIRCAVPSRSLTTMNVRNSIIVAGPVNGAAHLTNLVDSVLIVSCRQLRMHDCRNCEVYLQCSSNPIIEHCSAMRFGPLPDFSDLGDPEGHQKNFWDQVNDFNWLKAGHSPNWSAMSLAHRFEADRWNNIRNLNEGDPVDAVLAAFDIN